jgi:hypothetical protein
MQLAVHKITRRQRILDFLLPMLLLLHFGPTESDQSIAHGILHLTIHIAVHTVLEASKELSKIGVWT